MDKLFVIVFKVLILLVQCMALQINEGSTDEIRSKLFEAQEILRPFLKYNMWNIGEIK